MKTVNLILSKELKEAGYPQGECYFTWEIGIDKKKTPFLYENKGHNEADDPRYFASPTADEILDRLPKGLGVAKNNVGYSICLLDESWRKIIGLSNRELYEYAMDLTAADTLAKMWLYLKKEGLLG